MLDSQPNMLSSWCWSQVNFFHCHYTTSRPYRGDIGHLCPWVHHLFPRDSFSHLVPCPFSMRAEFTHLLQTWYWDLDLGRGWRGGATGFSRGKPRQGWQWKAGSDPGLGWTRKCLEPPGRNRVTQWPWCSKWGGRWETRWKAGKALGWGIQEWQSSQLKWGPSLKPLISAGPIKKTGADLKVLNWLIWLMGRTSGQEQNSFWIFRRRTENGA